MPEGDTIHNAARRVGAALVDRPIVSIDAPQPRHRRDRWPQRLDGRRGRSVDAHGKHLFLRFEGDLTLHSHLRMGGRWGVYAHGQRWARSARRAWLVLGTEAHDVVQFDGPVLELMTESRTRFDQRLAGLGPDLLSDDFDERACCARMIRPARSAKRCSTSATSQVSATSGNRRRATSPGWIRGARSGASPTTRRSRSSRARAR